MKDAGVCHRHVEGECEEDDNCSLIHSKLPYLWQYKLKDQDTWTKNFSIQQMKTIEQQFCDPACELAK